MPQGTFKSRKTLSGNLPPQKKKIQKSNLKMKKGKEKLFCLYIIANNNS